MARILLVYYDEYHTPLKLLREKLSADAAVIVLTISLGSEAGPPLVTTDAASAWQILEIDGRERFCEDYLTRAIKANARYEEGYYLSAALSRPVMASICAEQIEQQQIDTLIHGLAGNDQLRFEMGILTLSPQTKIISVAAMLGSRAAANEDSFTVSSNLWGRSIEAGSLGNPWEQPDREVFESLGFPANSTAAPETHTMRFERGRAIALDSVEMNLKTMIERLNALGKKFAVGCFDLVEDGYVGMKTRAVYESTAAHALITAHQDLERLISTRLQNLFKPLVDKAWAELVYDGYWFDPQRTALEAYIESVNRWVTGEVRLLYQPGGLRVAGRQSPHALYDESQAVYRAGQDFAIAGISELATFKSAQMKHAAQRECEGRRRAE